MKEEFEPDWIAIGLGTVLGLVLFLTCALIYDLNCEYKVEANGKVYKVFGKPEFHYGGYFETDDGIKVFPQGEVKIEKIGFTWSSTHSEE